VDDQNCGGKKYIQRKKMSLLLPSTLALTLSHNSSTPRYLRKKNVMLPQG